MIIETIQSNNFWLLTQLMALCFDLLLINSLLNKIMDSKF